MSTNPAPVEANGDTDRAVAVAFLRDAKGEPCKPFGPDERGRWYWLPGCASGLPAPVPAFSTDWAAAAKLSGYLRRAGWVTEIVMADTCSVTLRHADGTTVKAEAPAFPLALCRAAMEVVEKEASTTPAGPSRP